MPNRRFNKQSGEVQVRIGAPLYGNNAKDLTNEVYNWMVKRLS